MRSWKSEDSPGSFSNFLLAFNDWRSKEIMTLWWIICPMLFHLLGPSVLIDIGPIKLSLAPCGLCRIGSYNNPCPVCQISIYLIFFLLEQRLNPILKPKTSRHLALCSSRSNGHGVAQDTCCSWGVNGADTKRILVLLIFVFLFLL